MGSASGVIAKLASLIHVKDSKGKTPMDYALDGKRSMQSLSADGDGSAGCNRWDSSAGGKADYGECVAVLELFVDGEEVDDVVRRLREVIIKNNNSFALSSQLATGINASIVGKGDDEDCECEDPNCLPNTSWETNFGLYFGGAGGLVGNSCMGRGGALDVGKKKGGGDEDVEVKPALPRPQTPQMFGMDCPICFQTVLALKRHKEHGLVCVGCFERKEDTGG